MGLWPDQRTSFVRFVQFVVRSARPKAPEPFLYILLLAAFVPAEAPPVPDDLRVDLPEKPMSLLKRFGSRNHPETKARKARMQKARAGMAVTDETIANYTAARGFLYGEWFGASLMCASITLVYMLASPKVAASVAVAISVSLAMFAVGTYAFWTNHLYYKRLDFPWAKRWDTGAIVVAGAGAVFWLLFGLLVVLYRLGVEVGPTT